MPFPDGREKSREEGDMLSVGSHGLQRSPEHVEVCVWYLRVKLGLKQTWEASTS